MTLIHHYTITWKETYYNYTEENMSMNLVMFNIKARLVYRIS